MQAKLGAAFLIVALLYTLAGLAVPRLGLSPSGAMALLVSCYVVIGLGAAWIVSYTIGRRLRALAQAASRISQGDLTLRVETSGRDETAELACALDVMTESLFNVVVEVQSTAERINASAQSLSTTSLAINRSTDEIAATTREIAGGAEDQAHQVVRTAETTREFLHSVQRVSDRARGVHESATAAADRAAAGADDTRRAAEGIVRWTDTTASATAAVDGFRRKAGDIGNIVSAITSISLDLTPDASAGDQRGDRGGTCR